MCSLFSTWRGINRLGPYLSRTRSNTSRTHHRKLFNLRLLPDFLRMSSREEGDGLNQTEREPWLRIGDYSVFAWSLSGIETSVVLRCSDGFTCCFDMGHSSRESVKCDSVFISHGHLDHIVALPHHIKKRELMGLQAAKYFIPDHLLEPLTNVCVNFAEINGGNTTLTKPNLQSVNVGEKIKLSRGYYAIPFPTVHRVKSQGYILYKEKKLLKPEFVGLSGPEVGAKLRSGEVIHDVVQIPEVAYTGDTTFQVFTDEVYMPAPDLFRVKLLIVEATYIDDGEDKGCIELARQWGHIHLSEIFKNAELFEKVDNILLIHFSDKYSVRYIQRQVSETIPDSLRGKVHMATLAKQQYL